MSRTPQNTQTYTRETDQRGKRKTKETRPRRQLTYIPSTLSLQNLVLLSFSGPVCILCKDNGSVMQQRQDVKSDACPTSEFSFIEAALLKNDKIYIKRYGGRSLLQEEE